MGSRLERIMGTPLWGKRKFASRLTVDFCFGCRSLTVHKISPIDGVDEYAQVPEEQMPVAPLSGKLYLRQCRSCKLVTPLAAGHIPVVFRDDKLPLELLLKEKYPEVLTRWAAQLYIERQIASAPLTLAAPERQGRLAEIVAASRHEICLLGEGKIKIDLLTNKYARLYALVLMTFWIAFYLFCRYGVSPSASGKWLMFIMAIAILQPITRLSGDWLQRVFRWQIYRRECFYPRLARVLQAVPPDGYALQTELDRLCAGVEQANVRGWRLDAQRVLDLQMAAPASGTVKSGQS
jgi:hypothetical protein